MDIERGAGRAGGRKRGRAADERQGRKKEARQSGRKRKATNDVKMQGVGKEVRPVGGSRRV